jgi:ABC-type Fe3+/spermidine/putrescine transport system ATPase subunit
MFPHMTVHQNIAWALQLRKWPKEKMESRIGEMLKLVHLEGMEERRYRELSGGQAQRVVIARALAPQPDVMLLDEPLSQLDAKLRDELKLEIGEIHRRTGATIVMVTHDQGEALTIADSVLLMDRGKIVQQGTPLDLYRFPETVFSADFIGTNNFLRGTLKSVGDCCTAQVDASGDTVTAERYPLSAALGTPVWVCVRADDIDIIDEDQRGKFTNVVSATIDHAYLTGGTVIVQANLAGAKVRIHAGGSRRFQLLGKEGSTVLCSLGNISVIPRTTDTIPSSVEAAPVARG